MSLLPGPATNGGISSNAGQSVKPATIFGPDGTFYVTWYDDSSGNTEIYVKRWVESGSQVPLPPAAVMASDGTYEDKIHISWQESAQAASYQLFRSDSASGSKVKIGEPETNKFDDMSAVPGITYYFWVKACNSAGCSEFSAWDTGFVNTQAPAVPENVRASDGIYTDRVRLTWDAVAGTTHYEVYRSTANDGAKSLLDSPASPPYDDMAAEAGTTYTYWVKACNSAICSAFSDYDEGSLKEGFVLTLMTNGQGEVTVIPEKPSYESGETIHLSAAAASGWQFIGWSGDLSGDSNPVSLLMDSDKFVSALFQPDENGGSEDYLTFLPVILAGTSSSSADK